MSTENRVSWGSYIYSLPRSTWNACATWWNKPSLYSKVKNTIDAAHSITKNFHEDPEKFFHAACKGAVRGGIEGVQGEPTEDAEQQLSWMDRFKELAIQGVSAKTAPYLSKLLDMIDVYDLEEEERQLIEDSKTALKNALATQTNVVETAKKVWDYVSQYHLMCIKGNLNIKKSSNASAKQFRMEFDTNEQCDGKSPDLLLKQTKEELESLRKRYHLPAVPTTAPDSPSIESPLFSQPSKSEIKKLQKMEVQTDRASDEFSKKTTAYATMYAMHYLFQRSEDPSIFNRLISEGGNIEEKYLEHFGTGTKRLFYQAIYRILEMFLGPFIQDIIQGILGRTRAHLRKDEEVLQLIEDKVFDLSEYFGCVEKGREGYLASTDPNEGGTFMTYLIKNIMKYKSKESKTEFTEAELIQFFGEYIIQNFVSSPHITVGGYRIPLLSYLLEQIILAIRKALLRRVLDKTQIIEKLLTKGTQSIHHAELAIKQTLAQKLEEIIAAIELSRTHHITSLQDPQRGETKIDRVAKKSQFAIDRNLHRALQQHSHKLHRFIKIEACNGNDRDLRNLDRNNKVDNEALRIQGILPWKIPSIDKIMEDALTSVSEIAIPTLLEGKDEQIEHLFQTIFEVAQQSYDYIPDEQKAEAEYLHRKQCQEMDDELAKLQEKLARTALESTLENLYHQMTGEHYEAIKAFVQEEKQECISFTKKLHEKQTRLVNLCSTCDPKRYTPKYQILKRELAESIALMTDYLDLLSSKLTSNELNECYTDVKGDLHNIYANTIYSIQALFPKIEEVAKTLKVIQEDEQQAKSLQSSIDILSQLNIQAPAEEVENQLDTLQLSLSDSLKQKHASTFESLKAVLYARDASAAQLQHVLSVERLEHKLTRVQNRLDRYERLDTQLATLADLLYQEKTLKRSHQFPTDASVQREHQRLSQEIQRLHHSIFQTKDRKIQTELLPLLQKESSAELYLVFFDSWFNTRKSTTFSKVRALKSECKRKHTLMERQISSSRQKLGNKLTSNYVKNSIELSSKKIQEHLDSIQKDLQSSLDIHTQKLQLEFSKNAKTIDTDFTLTCERLTQISNMFGLKGYVSLGEKALFDMAAPIAINYFKKKITDAIQTMIDAAGNPFHYRQLMLRLIFLQVAIWHTEAS